MISIAGKNKSPRNSTVPKTIPNAGNHWARISHVKWMTLIAGKSNSPNYHVKSMISNAGPKCYRNYPADSMIKNAGKECSRSSKVKFKPKQMDLLIRPNKL